MPKKTNLFSEQINFLAPQGTTEMLIAISYFRGEAGSYAGPARDLIARGVREFVESLSDKDRRRFEEIRANVAISHSPPV